jgi:hypothetical protein
MTLPIACMTLIFLTGHHYAGKSALTKHLVDHQGFVEVALSDFLRVEALERLHAKGYLEVEMRDFYEGKDKPWPLDKDGYPTPRDYLKELGASLREKDPKTLAKMAQAKIEELFQKDPSAKIIVSDWRFPHEIEWVYGSPYFSCLERWKIVRPSTHPDKATIVARGPTEAYIDSLEVDRQLDNLGSLEDLFESFDSYGTTKYELSQK